MKNPSDEKPIEGVLETEPDPGSPRAILRTVADLAETVAGPAERLGAANLAVTAQDVAELARELPKGVDGMYREIKPTLEALRKFKEQFVGEGAKRVTRLRRPI